MKRIKRKKLNEYDKLFWESSLIGIAWTIFALAAPKITIGVTMAYSLSAILIAEGHEPTNKRFYRYLDTIKSKFNKAEEEIKERLDMEEEILHISPGPVKRHPYKIKEDATE